jgi:hypothetical protein
LRAFAIDGTYGAESLRATKTISARQTSLAVRMKEQIRISSAAQRILAPTCRGETVAAHRINATPIHPLLRWLSFASFYILSR